MQWTSTFLKAGISIAVFKSSEGWKKLTLMKQNIDKPQTKHITQSQRWPTCPSSRRKGSGHHFVHRLHTGSSTCLQPCPAKCCWIAGFCPRGSSCHRNLPSTSQANSLLPTELHSWTIIINFWSSLTNVLKMCLRRKLSDTTKKLLPETRFGLTVYTPVLH